MCPNLYTPSCPDRSCHLGMSTPLSLEPSRHFWGRGVMCRCSHGLYGPGSKKSEVLEDLDH